MFLYDRNEKNIEVYSLSPNEKAIYDYKKKQMETVPEEKRVLYASGNIKVLETENDYVKFDELNSNYDDFYDFSYFHSLDSYKMTEYEKARQVQLLERYYKQIYPNKVLHIRPFSVDEAKELMKNDLNELLLLEDYIENDYGRGYIMNNIINIPNSLYYLENFIAKKFDKINNNELNTILKLYDFEGSVATFDYDNLRRLEQFEIVNNIITDVDNKVESSTKVLSLIKK